MLSIPSKKLDRYILPVLVSAVLVSTFFFENFLDKIKNKWKYIVFVIPVCFAIWLHPNYLSYYSTGLKIGMNIIEPKWMLGQKEIVDYFSNIEGYEKVNMEARELSLRKNHDYGGSMDNIGLCGIHGVAVRLVDKVTRAHNLTRDGVKAKVNESVRDSFIDMINYATYAVMLLDGTWDGEKDDTTSQL